MAIAISVQNYANNSSVSKGITSYAPTPTPNKTTVTVSPTPQLDGGMYITADNRFVGVAYIDGKKVLNAYSIKIPVGWEVQYDKEKGMSMTLTKDEYQMYITIPDGGGDVCYFTREEGQYYIDIGFHAGERFENDVIKDLGWYKTTFGSYRAELHQIDVAGKTFVRLCGVQKGSVKTNGEPVYAPGTVIGVVGMAGPFDYDPKKLDEFLKFVKSIKYHPL